MLEPLSDENLLDYLTAFADRELDGPHTAEMWRYLANSPDRLVAIRWLEAHERLTLAAQRSLSTQTPKTLRTSITALANRTAITPSDGAESRTRPLEWRRIAAYAATIAAVLIGGLTLAAVFATKSRTNEPVPLTLIGDIDRIHSECARLPEALHNATFEQIDNSLARATAKDISSPWGAPDLTAQGYRLIGAGPCPAAELHLVHLLYRSLHPGSMAAVSIFVEHDGGQYPQLRWGKVYRIAPVISPYPMIAWRSGGNIYFLIADRADTETDVLEKIHPTPATQIETVAVR